MDLFGYLMNHLNDVFLSNSSLDQRVWVLESLGKFSYKSLLISLYEANSSLTFPFKKIWKPPVPPWIKAFAWTVAHKCRWRSFLQISSHWCVVQK